MIDKKASPQEAENEKEDEEEGECYGKGDSLLIPKGGCGIVHYDQLFAHMSHPNQSETNAKH